MSNDPWMSKPLRPLLSKAPNPPSPTEAGPSSQPIGLPKKRGRPRKTTFPQTEETRNITAGYSKILPPSLHSDENLSGEYEDSQSQRSGSSSRDQNTILPGTYLEGQPIKFSANQPITGSGNILGCVDITKNSTPVQIPEPSELISARVEPNDALTSRLKDLRNPIIQPDQLKIRIPPNGPSHDPPRRKRQSFIMELETTRTNTLASVKLLRWEDWGVWFGVLRQRAEMLGIWDYVDPDGLDSIDDKVALPKPVRKRDFLDQGQSSPMTYDQMEAYKRAAAEYEIDKDEVAHAFKAMLQIQQILDTTVDPRYLKVTITQDTLRKRLRILANTIRPSEESMRQSLLSRYELLKATPYGKEVQKYFDDWQCLKIDDQGQLMAGKVFPQGDYDPCRELIMTLKPIYPMKAEIQQQLLRAKGVNVKLLDEIEEWREHLRFERTERFPKKSGKDATASATAAGFQGTFKASTTKDEGTGGQTTSKSAEDLPDCLCGRKHHWAECFYLNDGYPRNPNWKPNKKVKEEVAKKLKDDKLRTRVEKSIKRWKEANGKQREGDKQNTFSAQELEASDKQEEELQPFSFASSYTASVETNFNLRNAVIYDTGSNVHVVNKYMEHRIISRKPAQQGQGLIAGGHFYPVKEIVHAEVFPAVGARKVIINMPDALFIPEFMTSVVASEKLSKKGLHFDTTDPDWMFTMIDNKRVRVCKFDSTISGHRVLETLSRKEEKDHEIFPTAMVAKEGDPLMMDSAKWHVTMGHPSMKAIEKLEENTEGCIVTDYNKHDPDTETPPKMMDCDVCIKSKAHALVSRSKDTHREVHQTKEMGHMAVVSWDLIEMLPSLSVLDDKAGATAQPATYKYISHFYFDNEAYHVATPVVSKQKAALNLEEVLRRVKHTLGAQVVMFRSDNEKAAVFNHTLKNLGIKHMVSAPNVPAQNGAAEASGKSIITKARCLTSESGLPKDLWPWLVRAAVYLLNRTPNAKLKMKTPYEAATKKKPYLGHLHPIGCKAFALIYGLPRRDKLAERAHVGFHIGYADSTNIFYIWIPVLNKVILARDVYFKDNELFKSIKENDRTLGEAIPSEDHQLIIQRIQIPETILPQPEQIKRKTSNPNMEGRKKSGLSKEWKPDQGEQQEQRQLPRPADAYPTPAPTEGQHSNAAPQDDELFAELFPDEYQTYVTHLMREPKEIELGVQDNEVAGPEGEGETQIVPKVQHRDLPDPPKSWKEMLRHKFSSHWQKSSREEVKKLYSHGTFEKVKEYKGHQVPLKWVWTYKLDENGWLLRFKARLCVRGDLQLPSIRDTYAATLAYKLFRSQCALIAANDLNTMQFDVVNAFPHAELNHDVYCQMPPGMEEKGFSLKLKRALYGLAESPKLWYDLLVKEFEEYGFQTIHGVKCLLQGHGMWVLFYVDDIVLSYHPKDEDKAQTFRKFLAQRFEIKYVGELKWFLGMEITRDRANRKIWISQRAYLEKLGTKFDLAGRKKYCSVPIPSTTSSMTKNLGQASNAAIKGFQVKVGSIGHAATSTRPDVAKAHAILAQFLQNPSEQHCELADHVLSYLYGTRNLALSYSANNRKVEMFVDASFADNVDRKSSQGLLIKMYGGAVDWKATKQKTVTTSTTEAELLALSNIAGYAYWWKRLFQETKMDIEEDCYTIYCDNTTAVRIARQEENTENTALRHVDIRQQWIIQEVEAGRLKVEWIPTSRQQADGFTKLLSRPMFLIFVDYLGLEKIDGDDKWE